MFIGHVTERPYQDPASGYFGAAGLPIKDLTLSNEIYDSKLGAELYNRYIDEYLYAEEVGFDAININEHHSTPFCMGGVMNLEAAIYARQSKKAKIVLLGNILPSWDDPLWLVEQLSIIDMISRGRLVSGFVRGGGRESISHNAPPANNWERFEEAHDFIVKAWTTPGPFRWEGKHYQYRYVNPWAVPYQKPHPPIWIPGIAQRQDGAVGCPSTATHTSCWPPSWSPPSSPTSYTGTLPRSWGTRPGTQNTAYVFKVHVDETEELADEVGRKFVQGPSNPFLAGNEGTNNLATTMLPGLRSRSALLPTRNVQTVARGGGSGQRPYERADQEVQHYLRHAQDGDTQDSPRAGISAARQHFLVGRRRLHEPRGHHAQPPAEGGGSAASHTRDGQRTGVVQPLRGGPGHQPSG